MLLQFQLSTKWLLAKQSHLISKDDAWTSQLSIFLTFGFSCINECSELSFHSTHTLRAVDIQNAHMKHLTMRIYWLWNWLCVEITIYSPPVTVTMARKGRALSTEPPLQPFPCAAFTFHGCHGDQQNEHDCTVRQTCRKGRRDVLFSPTMAFTLLCQRLSTSASLIRLPGLAVAHVEACANTQNTGCYRGGKYLPQVFVEYQPRVRC